MNAKKYLERYKYLYIEIWSMVKDIQQLKDLACSLSSIDYSKDRVQTSPSKEASFEGQADKYADIEEEGQAKIKELYRLKQEIEETINKVESPSERVVLKLIYINDMKTKDIVEQLSMSTPWVSKQHSNGLESIEKLIKIQ